MKEISIINAQLLPLTELTENNGQIEGLPANPRTIEPQDFANLKKSIEDNPEMLGMRELLVYEQDGQYIVIGGNMRLKAMRDLGYETAPCKVLPKETTIEQLKAILIKDNVQKGEWDTSMLLEDWDAAQLSEWGVSIPEVGEFNQNDLILEGGSFQEAINEKNLFSVTLLFNENQIQHVKDTMKSVGKDEFSNMVAKLCEEHSKDN